MVYASYPATAVAMDQWIVGAGRWLVTFGSAALLLYGSRKRGPCFAKRGPLDEAAA